MHTPSESLISIASRLGRKQFRLENWKKLRSEPVRYRAGLQRILEDATVKAREALSDDVLRYQPPERQYELLQDYVTIVGEVSLALSLLSDLGYVPEGIEMALSRFPIVQSVLEI